MSENRTVRRLQGIKARWSVLTVAALVAGLIGLGAAPAMAATGSLVGKVTSEQTGTPIVGAQVQLDKFNGDSFDFVGNFYTDASGHYSFAGLGTGQYQLYFYADNYVPEAWDNQVDYQNAQSFTVTDGSPTTINASLTEGATIAGTITGPGGVALTSGYVLAYHFSPTGEYSNSVGSGSIGAGGHYVVTQLPAGQYILRATPTSGSTLLEEYYNDAYTPAAGTIITVATSQDVTGYDMQLAAGGSISGTVTGQGSGALAGVTVQAYGASPMDGDVGVLATATTNASGQYSLATLSPGSYSIRFSDFGTNWAAEYYTNGLGIHDATPVSLGVSQVLTGINATLVAGSTISGTITKAVGGAALAGYATAERLDSDGTWEEVTNVQANGSGQYSLSGLPAGTYRVYVEGDTSDYALEYLGDSYFKDTAEHVTLAAGATSASHSTALQPAVSITARSKDQTTNMYVNASAYIEYQRSPGVWAEPDLSYGSGDVGLVHLGGLPAGDYRIHWVDQSGSSTPYVTEWWNNKPTADTATIITLAGGGSADVTALMTKTPFDVSPAPVPVITGVAQANQTLTAVPGTWGPAPVDLAYQWNVDGTAKPGATGATFPVTNAEIGKAITVTVVGSRDGLTSVSKTSSPTTAVAPTFQDVPTASSFYADTEWMFTSNVSTGYIESNNYRTYHPAATVTRRAMAAFLYRAAGSPAFTAPGTASFSDVPSDDQFYKEIEWMKAQGISVGTDNGNGTFSYKPGDPVSRQAMATFLYRAAGNPAFTPPGTPSFVDVPTTASTYLAIEWMKSVGITAGTNNGNGTFSYKPADPVSRQAMAAFLHRAHD